MSINLSVRPPFPAVWDNTMRASFSECPQKFRLAYLHGLSPSSPRVDLHAGAAFAKGVEIVRQSFHAQNADAATTRANGARALLTEYGTFDPGDSTKTPEAMLGALDSYITHYGLESDPIQPLFIGGKPAVEFNFAHPIDVMHPETGEPIIYCGRFDLLGILNGDPASVWVVDEKTTKQLGPTWSRQWSLRSQFMGYTWGCRKIGINTQGAIVRGISILKRTYGHAQAIVPFPQYMIDRWYTQLCRDLERAKQCWDSNLWDYAFGSECTSYGGCQFTNLCESADPQQWIEPYFTFREWDPMRLRLGEGN